MLPKLSHLIIARNGSQWPSYQNALQEFLTGELVGFEALLSRLRWLGILVYSVYLAFSIDNFAYVNRLGYLSLLAGLVSFHTISYWLEIRNPKYVAHNYKVLRYQFYLALVALLLFVGRGVGVHLLLFAPYVVFAGIYIGPIWSMIVTIEATLLTYEVYYYLGSLAFADYKLSEIFLRALVVLASGTVSTYFWYRQLQTRSVFMKQEREFNRIAAELVSALNVEMVGIRLERYLAELIDAHQGLIVIDDDDDGIYTVLSSWGYSNAQNFKLDASKSDNEGLIEWLLFNKKPCLVNDIQRWPVLLEIGEEQGCRSFLGTPLLAGDTLIGAVLVTSNHPYQFNKKHQELLDRLGYWLAIGLQNASRLGELSETHKHTAQSLKQLLMLQHASTAIQTETHSDRQLLYALIAITIKDSLEFNRAMIFLVESYGTFLCGECAIGPENAADAEKIYEDSLWNGVVKPAFITTVFNEYLDVYQEASLNKFVKTLRFPLREENKHNILIEAIAAPIQYRGLYRACDLPNDAFVEILRQVGEVADEFAIVPLVTQDKTIGVLYVDNRYNNKRIDDNALLLLRLFANQLAATIATARVMQQKDKVFYLLAHTLYCAPKSGHRNQGEIRRFTRL